MIEDLRETKQRTRIHVILWRNHVKRMTDKSTLAQLETIENNLIAAMDSSDYETAINEVNNMEILKKLSWDEREIWIKKQQNYSSLIQEKKRAFDLSNPNNILSPMNSEEFKKKTLDEARQIFLNAGFTNIISQEISGGGGLFKKKNLVEHINSAAKMTLQQKITSTKMKE